LEGEWVNSHRYFWSNSKPLLTQENAAALQERFPVLDEEQLEDTLPHHQAEPVMPLDEETLQTVHGGIEVEHIAQVAGTLVGCCIGAGAGVAFGLGTGLGAFPSGVIIGSLGGAAGGKVGSHVGNILKQNRQRREEAQQSGAHHPAQPPRPEV
jgi:hypothetical protein